MKIKKLYFCILFFLVTALQNACSSNNPAPSSVQPLTDSSTDVLKASALDKNQSSASVLKTLTIKGDDDFDDFEDEFQPVKEQLVYDPFENYNRWMTKFNDKMYLHLVFPIARGYEIITTEGMRFSIGRFFENLLYPVRVSNNILQAKFQCSGKETLRFLINSTIGLLGFFDPAKAWFKLTPCNEDFGQTLGFWGVRPGPHFVLPFLGPSNLRDTFSLYPDSKATPIYYIEPIEASYATTAYKVINETPPKINEYHSIKKDAVDLYLFFRDIYEQNRNKKIKE